MSDKRKAARWGESSLPPQFHKLTVRNGNASFPCHAIDAGAYGLGLVADGEHQNKLSVRQKVEVDFGYFKVDAEVLNIAESFHGKNFRFGVFLPDHDQLKPFWGLLEGSARP